MVKKALARTMKMGFTRSSRQLYYSWIISNGLHSLPKLVYFNGRHKFRFHKDVINLPWYKLGNGMTRQPLYAISTIRKQRVYQFVFYLHGVSNSYDIKAHQIFHGYRHRYA